MQQSPYTRKLSRKSGYDYKLHYNPQPAKPKQHQRNRNVVWFNPPYSTNVATNVGKRFLAIITECFPPNHILHKILNRNTLKLSYSCMPNIGNIISAHNQSVLAKKPQQISVPKDKNCNCRQKDDCPLSQKCLVESVVYQATVTRDDNNDQQTYVGLTAGDFKTRYNNHTSSFRNPKHKNSTVLSKYIWTLKDSKILYSIKWKILRKCKPYSSRTKRCNLCLHEKYIIICYPELSSLNSRNELISTCPHRKKHLLCNQ